MILEILQHPDPRLRETCAPADVPDAGLIENMFETMYTAAGRGLAAPQVGIMTRIFVMDTTWKEGRQAPMVFVNPSITAQGGRQSNQEGCLSIADHPVQVERAQWVDLHWSDMNGAAQNARFEGFEAACVCHEIDHLDGRLILDYEGAA